MKTDGRIFLLVDFCLLSDILIYSVAVKIKGGNNFDIFQYSTGYLWQSSAKCIVTVGDIWRDALIKIS